MVAATVGRSRSCSRFWTWLVETYAPRTPAGARRGRHGRRPGSAWRLTVICHFLPPGDRSRWAPTPGPMRPQAFSLPAGRARGGHTTPTGPRPSIRPPIPASPASARHGRRRHVQLVVGAIMRHTGAGLAIPDFPLAMGRIIPPFESARDRHSTSSIAWVPSRWPRMVAWSAVRTLRTHAGERTVVRPALGAVALVVIQVMLGALTIWTQKAVLPTTAHVAVGAAVLREHPPAGLAGAARRQRGQRVAGAPPRHRARPPHDARAETRRGVRARPRGPALVQRRTSDFVALTKPRVVMMVVLTTLFGYYLGATRRAVRLAAPRADAPGDEPRRQRHDGTQPIPGARPRRPDACAPASAPFPTAGSRRGTPSSSEPGSPSSASCSCSWAVNPCPPW